jgi:hypothetical protein
MQTGEGDASRVYNVIIPIPQIQRAKYRVQGFLFRVCLEEIYKLFYRFFKSSFADSKLGFLCGKGSSLIQLQVLSYFP